MSKAKKPKKDSEPEKPNDDGNDGEEEADAKIAEDKIAVSSPETSPAKEKVADDEFPEEWRTMPFADLKMEGWRPRIKKKTQGGKRYLTIRRTWLKPDGKMKSLERGMGVFEEKRWKLLQDLLFDGASPNDESDEREDVPSLEERPSIKISELESSRKLTQPPGYTGKGTRILQSAVSRHLNIPERFYYDTDLLEFFEYFHDKGYEGNIVEWIHECVRNYLIEHHYKVGVIIEKGIISNG